MKDHDARELLLILIRKQHQLEARLEKLDGKPQDHYFEGKLDYWIEKIKK